MPSGRFRVEIQTFDSVAYFYNNIKVNKKAIFSEWAKLQVKTHSLVLNYDFFNKKEVDDEDNYISVTEGCETECARTWARMNVISIKQLVKKPVNDVDYGEEESIPFKSFLGMC